MRSRFEFASKFHPSVVIKDGSASSDKVEPQSRKCFELKGIELDYFMASSAHRTAAIVGGHSTGCFWN